MMSSAQVVGTTLERLPVSSEGAESRVRWYSPRNVIRALLPLAALLSWHVLSSTGVIQPQYFPSPVTVFEALVELGRSGELGQAVPASLARAGTGLAIGIAIGIVFGVLNGLSRGFEEVFDSSFQIVRQVPFIAMVPLFIIWFGIDESFKIVIITLACIFPVYINTYSGVRNVDPKLVETGRVFGLSRFQSVRQIILPAALPAVLVGVRYSMGVSLLALIVAEQVNTENGIGHIIFVATGALRIDIITGAILIYAVLGVLVDITMRFFERRLLPWK